MPTTIDSLELQVKNSSDDAVKGIDSLAASLGKLKTATKGGIGLTSVVNQLGKLNEATKGTDNSGIDKLTRLGDALGKIASLGKVSNLGSIARGITKIGEAVNGISLSGVENLESVTDAVANLGSLGNVHIPTISQPTGDTPSTPPTDTSGLGDGAQNISDAVEEVRRYTDEATRAQSQTGYWGSQLTMAATNIRAAYAPAGEAIKTAFTNVVGKVQSLGSAIRNLPSTALTGLATIPVKIGSAFASAASKVKGFASKIKEAASTKIKTGLQGIANKIKEISGHSGNATGKLGQFFNSIKRIALYRTIRFFFSQLTAAMKEGINNLYQYSNVMGGTFAGSMDRLATSFQYLKNSLGAMVSPIINALAPAVDFLIDKFVTLLNVVNQFFARLTGASTFTAAKKQATSYGGAISSAGGAAKKAAKEIKDATLGIDELNIISQPDDDTGSGGGGGGAGGGNYGDMFQELPIDSSISDFVDKLKAAFEAGDWKELGTLLGNKFNEIVDSIDWSGIGHKIGYGINGAVQTAYWFLKTADFKNLGNHIAELFNGAMEEIDFTYVGRLLTRGITAALDLLLGFLGGLDWGLVGKSIGDGLRGAFDEAQEWITSIDWSQMAHNLYANIKKFLTGIDFASLAKSFFKMLGSALGAAVSFLGTFIADVIKDIKAYFLKYIEDENGDGKFGGIEIIKGVLKGIWEGIKGIGKWIKENVLDPFVEGFKEAFGIHSPSTVMIEYGKMIVEGLYKGCLLYTSPSPRDA